jgi:hypothetical protein
LIKASNLSDEQFQREVVNYGQYSGPARAMIAGSGLLLHPIVGSQPPRAGTSGANPFDRI